MSRDGELREGLRDLEAAAPGGLTIDDARRALAALRRGGLVLHQLLEDVPVEGPRSLGFLLGPALRASAFEVLRASYGSLEGVVIRQAIEMRSRATAGNTRVLGSVELAIVDSAVTELWGRFGAEHGATFAAWLEKHHGFLRVDPDVVSLLRWRV